MVHSRTGRLWQRRLRLACLLCVWMALALGIAPIFAQEPEAVMAEPIAKQKELLEQQNQYLQEVQQLRKEGKLAEAIEAAEKMLAIERELFGDVHAEVAGTLVILAKMYLQKDDFAAAGRSCREAASINEKLFGAEHWRTTHARLALAHVERLAAMTADERQQVAQAKDLATQAVQFYRQGKYTDAIVLARKVAEARKTLLGQTHPDYATSLNGLAVLHKSMGDYARAGPLFRQALEIRMEVLGEKHPHCADSLNNLAVLYESMGDYAPAELLYQQALEIKKEVLGEKHPDYATSLNGLAVLYKSMGDYARAEPLYQEALEIRKEVLGEKHPRYATSMNNLAMLYKSMGDYARAEPLLRQALEIRKEVLGEKHPNYADSLNNLAMLYESMGDHARAEPLLRQDLEITKEALGEKHPDYATSLNNLAGLYHSMSDYARAEPLYQEALEIRKEVLGEKHPDYATSLNNLAGMYRSMRDYARAEPLLLETREIWKEVLGEKHPRYATSLNNLAVLYKAMGDYAHAEPLYQQALEITKEVLGEKHPNYADSLNNLAMLYYSMGDYAGAEPLYQEALESSRRHLELTAVVQSERQQLAMGQMLRYHLDAYLSLSVRAEQFGETAYRQTLAWKGATMARQRQIRVVAEEPELAPLFGQLQQAASRLAKLALATPEPAKQAVWHRQVAELSAEKERLEAELARRSSAYREVKKEVTLEDLLASLPEDSALVDFLEYRHSSPPESGKGPLSFERRLVAFVIRRGRPVEPISLGPAAPLGQAIDTWRVTYGMSPDGARAGRLLRERVWEPVAPKLAGVKTVLVSPDGVLGRMPLAALPGKEAGTYLLEEQRIAVLPVPQLLPALVSELGRKELKATMLLLGGVDYNAEPGQPAEKENKRSGRPHRAVRWQEQQPFSRLKGTGDEIATIEKLYAKSWEREGITTLEGLEASEETFRREAPRNLYLHLATHGYFAPPSLRSAFAPAAAGKGAGGAMRFSGSSSMDVGGLHPGLLSGLALAGANRPPEPEGDDGILTAEEVATMNLGGVELVVLSACETGLGEVAGGEGLLGLQRAFQISGARTVVASLWKVDDAATKALMVEFYKNLWEEKLGKLEALRQAQLKMMRDYDPSTGQFRGGGVPRPVDPDKLAAAKEAGGKPQKPLYWAAFVLSGDWR